MVQFISQKLDKAKWDRAKRDAIKQYSSDGKWNARVAQQAVRIYKERGGRFGGKKKRVNSLGKWTKQDWTYVNGNPQGRYLPRAVIAKLTPAQRAETNRNKIAGRRKGLKRVPWEPFVRAAYNKIK